MYPELEQMLVDNSHAGYLRFHLPRYVSLFSALVERQRPGHTILDIGSSAFTEALRARFGRVDTLGFGPDRAGDAGRHYAFNLNDSRDRAAWRTDLPKYDLVVFAEVLEHLHTSPAEVLPFLRTLLTDNGALFLQTPNAVSLNKRLKMVRGFNPYELIRDSAREPGHFREYTRVELERYLRDAGFDVDSFRFENYFDHVYIRHKDVTQLQPRAVGRLYNLAFSLVPGSLKPGMFFIARNPSGR